MGERNKDTLTFSKVPHFYFDNLGYFLINTIKVVRVREKAQEREKPSLDAHPGSRSEGSFSSSMYRHISIHSVDATWLDKQGIGVVGSNHHPNKQANTIDLLITNHYLHPLT